MFQDIFAWVMILICAVVAVGGFIYENSSTRKKEDSKEKQENE